MNVETQIELNKFCARPYQQDILDALDKGYKKILIVLPRRSGKDLTCWNIAIHQCIRKVCLVQYILPTFGQARRSIWEAIDSNGNSFLSYIPRQLISKVNSADMKVVFSNGSILQCVGGDTHDTSIRGTNPFMVVLSEYAYMQSEEVYNTIRPILAANGGSVLVNSTPRGKNFFWHMFNIAQELPEWFVMLKTVDDIAHIPVESLNQERTQMSPELFAQEYMCSFTRGVQGAIFGTCLEDIKRKGQITSVAWEPGLLVHVAIDIGVNDATTIIFFQVVGEGTIIRIIDCYSNNNVGLDHYAHHIQQKPYRYGKYFAPHDLKVREWGGGAITRYEKARQLDLKFDILDQIDIGDSIENVMTHFPKFWIDAENCRSLVNAIENYYREWDEKRQIYNPKPAKGWANHYCDALRYMCQAIHKTKKGLTADEFNRKRAEILYGNQKFSTPIFNEYFDKNR